MAKKDAHPATRSTRELIPAHLAGTDYMVRPPKGYVGILIASKFQNQGQGDDFDAEEFMESVDLVIKTLFTKSDAKKVRERLLDPDDELDVSDILEEFPRIVERASGNPTT